MEAYLRIVLAETLIALSRHREAKCKSLPRYRRLRNKECSPRALRPLNFFESPSDAEGRFRFPGRRSRRISKHTGSVAFSRAVGLPTTPVVTKNTSREPQNEADQPDPRGDGREGTV